METNPKRRESEYDKTQQLIADARELAGSPEVDEPVRKKRKRTGRAPKVKGGAA